MGSRARLYLAAGRSGILALGDQVVLVRAAYNGQHRSLPALRAGWKCCRRPRTCARGLGGARSGIGLLHWNLWWRALLGSKGSCSGVGVGNEVF